ncbi:hypothetical protein [Amycolatopsis sp. NPDC051371]|uniref:hypothetical protein n=1 Tax=Amycolatopsis sp. NPDC051371 TaxID=3155800 RepID=UPI0034357D96
MTRSDYQRVARATLAAARNRAAIAEATGILAAQGDNEGRETLRAPHGRAGEDAEAARVVAATNAAAECRADPDWL